MAIATNGGHVSRALDFYNSKDSMYFIIGGTKPWTHIENGVEVTDDETPTTLNASAYKLNDVVGLKLIDNIYFVRPAKPEESQNPGESLIKYRSQDWKRIDPPEVSATLTSQVSAGSFKINVSSASLAKEGIRVRVGDTYEGEVTSYSGLELTLDTAAPVSIPSGAPVLGGAMVEGAKYVYIDCYLNYDNFPIVDTENNNLSYRQIGLCTGVIPNPAVTPEIEGILRAASYATSGVNEYSSLGILEILDNRIPSTRNINQREQLSLIIEF